jgi:phospholipase/carboxylesterase
MTLDFIEAQTGDNPVATIVIMHGLGADGNDFVPIAEQLDLSSVGAVRFVFPNAPVIPVTINGGYRMRQSQQAIEQLLEQEKARGIPANKIVIAGFSQGCAMALMVGLRHSERLAGIVGMSGYLPLAATTAAERHAANQSTPIFMAHGRFDPMVQLDRATASREALAGLGYKVDWHEYPMEHSVCPQEVLDLNAWLLKVLA